MIFFPSLENLVLLLPFLIFAVGLSCIFLRRLVLWCVVGQVVAIKSAIAAGFIASTLHESGHKDLVFISLMLLGLLPQLCMVGMVAIHRCGRFGGSLDMSERGDLRH